MKNLIKKINHNENLLWVYGISFLFILLNAVSLYFEFYYFSLIPVFLLVVLMAFLALDKLIMLTVFLTPLSIPLRDIARGYDFNMSLPVEPLLFGVLLVFIFKLLTERKFDKRIARHPVSIAIYANLVWIFMTAITSTMPIVSFKFLLSRLWFVVAFYFICTQIFKNYKNIKRFIWLYVLPFTIVIGYTLFRHAEQGFGQQAAHWSMNPFYNDHTSYGAILAMFLPILIGMATKSSYSINRKVFIWIFSIIFIVATIFSYTRATWVSLAGAIGVWLILILGIKFRTLLILGILAGLLVMSQWNNIMLQLEQNKVESSTDFEDHVKSISNVASDASNMERINRWKSAMRMFAEKPVFGFGPGTYMFKYAPYQFSYDKTIISTNAGDMGNAHSEYIGPLAESGVFGMLTFIAIVAATIYTGVMVRMRTKEKDKKAMITVILLGLITYFLHGLLNNFLDTVKASAPFWGFIAMLVAYDVYHVKENAGCDSKSLPE